MSEHTPGPWSYDGEYIWADAVQGYVADPNTEDLRSGEHVPLSKAQATIDANARLIAAAPALVVALQKIAAIETQMVGADWDEIEQARQVASAALKEAGYA